MIYKYIYYISYIYILFTTEQFLKVAIEIYYSYVLYVYNLFIIKFSLQLLNLNKSISKATRLYHAPIRLNSLYNKGFLRCL